MNKIKAKQATSSEEPDHDKDISADIVPPPKNKKPLDIIDPDEPVTEKVDDEVSEDGESIEDELEDEVTLDDEELNPFGDKWEE